MWTPHGDGGWAPRRIGGRSGRAGTCPLSGHRLSTASAPAVHRPKCAHPQSCPQMWVKSWSCVSAARPVVAHAQRWLVLGAVAGVAIAAATLVRSGAPNGATPVAVPAPQRAAKYLTSDSLGRAGHRGPRAPAGILCLRSTARGQVRTNEAPGARGRPGGQAPPPPRDSAHAFRRRTEAGPNRRLHDDTHRTTAAGARRRARQGPPRARPGSGSRPRLRPRRGSLGPGPPRPGLAPAWLRGPGRPAPAPPAPAGPVGASGAAGADAHPSCPNRRQLGHFRLARVRAPCRRPSGHACGLDGPSVHRRSTVGRYVGT
jgi:hypothetical protein